MTIGCTLLRAVAWSSLSLMVHGVLAQRARAAEFDYDASVGAGHSDNISRTPINEQDEDLANARVRFSAAQNSSRLQADAIGDVAYTDYLDDTYDSEVLGSLAANARFAFVPQRFEWSASDNYGQVLSDPFAPATPDNRENINHFSTGPDLTFAFGSQMRLRLGGRYTLTTYEDSPLDSDTVSGDLALIRQLSSSSTVSLNVRSQQIKYDEPGLDADYDQNDAFLRYEATGGRTQLGVDAGYSEIKPDNASSDDGMVLRLNLVRQLSASMRANFSVGREFANSGATFARMQAGNGVGLEPTPGQQTALAFTSEYVTLGWSFTRQRTAVSITASRFDQTYQDADALSQTFTTANLQASRQLSQRTSVVVNGLFARGDFEQDDADYDDLTARASFVWRLSRAVSLSATYSHIKRDSDNPAAEFAENQVWLSIGYGRGLVRSAFLGPEFAVQQGT